MDKIQGILYFLSIMKKKPVHFLSIFIAVIFAGFVVLYAGIGMAGPSSVPLPAKKPLLANVPLPAHKPLVLKRPTKISDRLSSSEASLYRDIFGLQQDGKIKQADEKIAQLDNALLMGHVLAQRYLHPTATHASFSELRGWLDAYSHLPQASRIYTLANKRKPDDFEDRLKEPVTTPIIAGQLGTVSGDGKIYRSAKKRSHDQKKQVSSLSRTIRNHIQQYEPTQALKLLNTHAAAVYMDEVEKDRLRALVAAGYLYAGKLDQSLKYANAALKNSGQYAPMAGWVSGLVHWQRGNYKKAARSFEVTASSPYATGWMISASAYWASRAHMRAGNVKLVSHWVRLSASYPRTFYGLIATRALGQDYDFDWSKPKATRDVVKSIETTKAGARAKALIEAGQLDLAETELRQLYKKQDSRMRESLLAYAYDNQLPNLTFRLGNAVSKPGGGLYDAALYPLVPWEPKGGYKVDKALLHAFIRQESQFNTGAESRSGATGLMQLMPSTASYISGKSIYKEKEGRNQLRDPKINLGLGQTYLSRLLNHEVVGQDLLSLAIAYNAGPGKLSKWKRERTHINDPLMFIETIPYAETRAFVERVLSNYWIYRIQLGQPTPSLDAVAEGRWARYAAMDGGAVKFAENK